MSLPLSSVVLLVSALHGLFLVVALLAGRRVSRPARDYLVLLIASYSLHLLEYALNLGGVTEHALHLLFTTVPLTLLVGPAYYLYVRAALNKPRLPGRVEALHYVPAVVCLLLLLPFYFQPTAAKDEFLRDAAQTGGGVAALVFLSLNLIQIGSYAVAAGVCVRRAIVTSLDTVSTLDERLPWLRFLSTLMLGATAVFLVAAVANWLAGGFVAALDYAAVLALAVIVHAVGYVALAHPEALAVQPLPVTSGKYERSGLDADRASDIVAQLDRCMTEELLYRNPNLRLADLARVAGASPHHVSQALNQERGITFFDFVNAARVRDVAARLARDGAGDITVLAVAHEAGFNSKASFNRAFKKHTGMSPSEYIRRAGGHQPPPETSPSR